MLQTYVKRKNYAKEIGILFVHPARVPNIDRSDQ